MNPKPPVWIGIDPGVSGGVAFLHDDNSLTTMPFLGESRTRLATAITIYAVEFSATVCLEKVSSSPQMGVVSAFTFGENYGWWKGILDTVGLNPYLVHPRKWQGVLCCLTGGDKEISRLKAVEMFPHCRITKDIADAVLLAYYGRLAYAVH